jgi:hypothetical protein
MDNHSDTLRKRVKRNREERAADKRRIEREQLRYQEYQDAPEQTQMGFWCRACNADFEAPALKTFAMGFDVDKGCAYAILPLFAFFVGHCPKGHKAIRHISDKHTDPYYMESAMLKQQRLALADDLLQPDDPRFRIKYPQQWRAMQEDKERAE